ncbi:SLC13 family permease [Ancrocorticia populi]|uniref:Transporter n=1 Tax=Ancrocorticia populi TaxID=2175228 RepID=A0A2V1K8B4_9ACTO|nr:DASS family sodium-coupled anion symporter [Ancrocorticia populi]PWF25747.1 transporter [Ancrocorticia populi]
MNTIPPSKSDGNAKPFRGFRRKVAERHRTGEAEISTRSKLKKRRAKSRLTRSQLLGRVGAGFGLLIPLLVDIPGLGPAGERMLGIFIAAILLWATEAVPLYATAVAVIFAQVLLISDQAILPVAEDAPSAETFFNSLSNPVIILFMGGFLLADCAAKFRVDRALAAVLLRPFLKSARLTVLGVMAITALLGMFMSNTATTAAMFAVVIPVMKALPEGKARAGLALSIPAAANVSGISTPVSSPPNAIALAALENNGIHITFVEWMIAAVPLAIIMMIAVWAFIAFSFIPADLKMEIDTFAKFNTSKRAIAFYIVAITTIVLWMTEPLHGVSSNTVGFLPVVALLLLGVMNGGDIRKLDWPILWLVAGGIALGSGVGLTGLDEWLIGSIAWESIPSSVVFLALAALTAVVGVFLSNSAAANLLIPMAIGISSGLEGTTAQIAVVVALACSMGVLLPISTPPNAIAYSTGAVQTKDMVKVGLVIGGVGVVLLAFVMPHLWDMLGVI